jgi:hypothetical protein
LKKLPDISSVPFWDVHFEKTAEEYQKYSTYIISKVFDYGSLSDLIEIIRYYGKKRIKEEIVKAGSLRKKTLAFACVLFNLKPTNFKCFIRKQSSQLLWNY